MAIIDTLTDRLRIVMRDYNVKAAPLARRASLNESAVRDILRGRSKNPGIVTLAKIAGVLELRPSALFEAGETWPVVGDVSGDGEITDPVFAEDEADGVENPFFYYREQPLSALKVKGGAVAPLAFEGDYLAYMPRESGVSEDDLGRPCVCVLADGRKLVRIVRMSEEGGKYHLAPVNLYGSTETNVALTSASRVMLTLPKSLAPDLPRPTHPADPNVLHEEQTPIKRGGRGKAAAKSKATTT